MGGKAFLEEAPAQENQEAVSQATESDTTDNNPTAPTQPEVFEVGDVVQLKGGNGPDCTVTMVDMYAGKIEIRWFTYDTQELRYAVLDPRAVTHVNEQEF